MKFFDLTFPTPAENLACDEALLDLCDGGLGHEVLRFWEPTDRFAVVGYANQTALELDLEACKAARIGVFRRCSGGGTVLQVPGCLNYCLILCIPDSGPLRSIAGANRHILQRHQAALEPLVKAAIQICGHTDLAIQNLKFSGNSQRRKRRFLLFHGTFLLRADISLIEKFLRAPSKQPDYRRDRSHREFLMNLGLAPEPVKSALQEAWNARESLADLPLQKIRDLARHKYSNAEWNLRF